MTTQQFIADKYQVDNGREQWCSSVLKDHEGNMYSWGKHYPLVFRINDLDFVNTYGYSNSTRRHIAWARQAVPDAIPVVLPKHTKLQWIDKHDILNYLRAELREIREEMETKKRHDTWVYKDLQNREVRVIQAGLKVKESL